MQHNAINTISFYQAQLYRKAITKEDELLHLQATTSHQYDIAKEHSLNLFNDLFTMCSQLPRDKLPQPLQTAFEDDERFKQMLEQLQKAQKEEETAFDTMLLTKLN